MKDKGSRSREKDPSTNLGLLIHTKGTENRNDGNSILLRKRDELLSCLFSVYFTYGLLHTSWSCLNDIKVWRTKINTKICHKYEGVFGYGTLYVCGSYLVCEFLHTQTSKPVSHSIGFTWLRGGVGFSRLTVLESYSRGTDRDEELWSLRMGSQYPETYLVNWGGPAKQKPTSDLQCNERNP